MGFRKVSRGKYLLIPCPSYFPPFDVISWLEMLSKRKLLGVPDHMGPWPTVNHPESEWFSGQVICMIHLLTPSFLSNTIFTFPPAPSTAFSNASIPPPTPKYITLAATRQKWGRAEVELVRSERCASSPDKGWVSASNDGPLRSARDERRREMRLWRLDGRYIVSDVRIRLYGCCVLRIHVSISDQVPLTNAKSILCSFNDSVKAESSSGVSGSSPGSDMSVSGRGGSCLVRNGFEAGEAT